MVPGERCRCGSSFLAQPASVPTHIVGQVWCGQCTATVRVQCAAGCGRSTARVRDSLLRFNAEGSCQIACVCGSCIAVQVSAWGNRCSCNYMSAPHVACRRHSDVVVVAVRIKADKCGSADALRALGNARVVVLDVTVWRGFVTPLNMCLGYACDIGAQHIMFQSVEVVSRRAHVQALLAHMDSDTLAAGAALPGCHDWCLGRHAATGLRSPWNTMTVWHVPTLSRTGTCRRVSPGIFVLVPSCSCVSSASCGSRSRVQAFCWLRMACLVWWEVASRR